MRIRIHGWRGMVDVLDRACRARPCLKVGINWGPYVAGRGYTSYHVTPHAVCLTRHVSGCPPEVGKSKERE